MAGAMKVSDVVLMMDAAAKANLEPWEISDYEKYRDSLIADGESADDMFHILSGYIWDASEEAPSDD